MNSAGTPNIPPDVSTSAGWAHRAEVAAIAALCAFGFAVRFLAFRPHELGLDGHLSVGLALMPTAQMLAFNLRDVHPPLFYLLLDGWLNIAGLDLIAPRWLAVAAGTLSVALIYNLSRRMLGTAPSIVAAALLAWSPAHIFMSATVRDFGLGLTLSLITGRLLFAYCTPASRSHSHGAVTAIGLGLASGVAFLTWYFHAVFLVIEIAVLVVIRPARWRTAVVTLLSGVLISLPWLALALPPLISKATEGVTAGGGARRGIELALFLREVALSFVGSLPVPWELLVLLGGCAYCLGLLTLAQRPATRALACISAAGTVLGLAFAAVLSGQWVQSLFITRFLMIPLPFVVLGEAGLLSVRNVRARLLALGVVLAVLVPATASSVALITSDGIPYQRNPGLAYLESQLLPGDAVLFTDAARAGYFRMRNPNSPPTAVIHFAGAAFLEEDVEKAAAELIPSLLQQNKRVWLFNSQQPDKPGLRKTIEQALGSPVVDRVVLKDDFSYAEILCFPGRRQ